MKLNLTAKIKKFPLRPGVYQFIDKKGRVLYIGRAVNLRRRVLNYFQKNIDSRLREMVESANGVKFQKTENLLEAVILEANLIKKYWPKYNIREKDDKSFIYVVIPKADFPKPLVVRGRELEKFLPRTKFNMGTSDIRKKTLMFGMSDVNAPNIGARVFGPYQSLSVIQNALKIIRRVFPYSTCQPPEQKIKNSRGRICVAEGQRPEARYSRACFYYQIGLCPGVCIGAISKSDYQKNIKNMILLLSGEKKKLLEKLRKENPEKAAVLKHIQDVALVSESEIKTSPIRIETYDISHLHGKETVGAMAVFAGGEPDKTQYRLFKIKGAKTHDDLSALKEMIERRFNHPEWRFPDLILVDGGRPQVNYVGKFFESRKMNIPFVGISKFAGDKIVFPPKMKKSQKELISEMKPVLLKSRDEAHRFAISFSRRRRRLKS